MPPETCWMKNTKTDRSSILVLGIGNTGRADDGLGWKFLDELSTSPAEDLTVEYRYQLQIEDSELVSRYQTVFFVDASHSRIQDGFSIMPATPAAYYHFSSHAQNPETILYLAKTIFNKCPKAFTVAIAGQKWGLKQGLSKAASDNLRKALDGFHAKITSGV